MRLWPDFCLHSCHRSAKYRWGVHYYCKSCNNFLASVGWVCNTKASQFVPSIKFKIGRFFKTNCSNDLQPILQDTPEHLNFSTFLLQSLKTEWCDFLWENCSSAGALSKHGFRPCPSIIRNSKRRTQNPSKLLKKNTFESKGQQYTTDKVIQHLFNIDLYTCLAIHYYRSSKW